MRSLLIDELMNSDIQKLTEHFQQALEPSSLPDVFWLKMPEELLTDEQKDHADCAPHRVAVVLGEDWLKIELLVRGHGRMRCSCFAFTEGRAREFLVDYLDRLIADLGLST